MLNPRPRSASVTAAATLLVLYSAAALLLWGYLFLPLLNAPPDESGRHIYELHLIPFLLLALVPPALIAGGVRTAVGLFQLKPWARIAVLAGAAVALLFCLAIIALWPFETFVIPHHFVSPLQSFRQRLGVAFVVVWLPISIWWLILFRTKSVKAQFIGTNKGQSAAKLPSAEPV
jgi:uncharacterized membrane protein YccF (DUF307 family)